MYLRAAIVFVLSATAAATAATTVSFGAATVATRLDVEMEDSKRGIHGRQSIYFASRPSRRRRQRLLAFGTRIRGAHPRHVESHGIFGSVWIDVSARPFVAWIQRPAETGLRLFRREKDRLSNHSHRLFANHRQTRFPKDGAVATRTPPAAPIALDRLRADPRKRVPRQNPNVCRDLDFHDEPTAGLRRHGQRLRAAAVRAVLRLRSHLQSPAF